MVQPRDSGTTRTPLLEGLLLVHKPPGLTSHDVVDIVRRKLAIRRIGHTGTLDPMAEGLLILLIGAATKRQQSFQTHGKLYEATLQLGTQTDTGDAMGAIVRTAPVPMLAHDHITEVLQSFNGRHMQTPPAYSAVKVRGRPAYYWARRQMPVTLAPRPIHLSDMTLVACGPSTITFRVQCSAGTYVRTMAESIAQRLGTVGHLARLVRLRVGTWALDEARPLAWINDASVEQLIREVRPCG